MEMRFKAQGIERMEGVSFSDPYIIKCFEHSDRVTWLYVLDELCKR
jgi:hypothetical protein